MSIPQDSVTNQYVAIPLMSHRCRASVFFFGHLLPHPATAPSAPTTAYKPSNVVEGMLPCPICMPFLLACLLCSTAHLSPHPASLPKPATACKLPNVVEGMLPNLPFFPHLFALFYWPSLTPPSIPFETCRCLQTVNCCAGRALILRALSVRGCLQH